MKYSWLLLLLLGCPSGETPPKPPPPPVDTTDEPPPPPVPPPPMPPPEPPAPPPAPPKPDSVKLVVYPPRLTVNVGETSYLCIAFRFENGHYAMPTDGMFRNLVAFDQTCDVLFRRMYDPAERQVTEAEQREADYRAQLVGWRGDDSLVVGVQTLKGGILPHALQYAKWKAWSESNPRKTHGYDSTQVFARYGEQEASAWVVVRTMGWTVAP